VACILELLEAMDATLPEPVRDLDAPFLMPVEGVCTIPGRGTVVTGRVVRGRLEPHGEVTILGGPSDGSDTVVVTSIQEFHRDVPQALAGHNVGLLLRGVERGRVVRGQVVVQPGSVAAHRRARAEVVLLRTEEGGRRTPCRSGYMPQLFFGATDVPGRLHFDVAELLPGDRADVEVELGRAVAFEVGMRFAMREGGRTVGAGVVTAVS
jgi:elongation factor Tu